MPIVTVPSCSSRAHSWVRAYLSPAGISLICHSVDASAQARGQGSRSAIAPALDCASFEDFSALAHEWRLDDPGRQPFAADLHFAGPLGRPGHARKRDTV